MKKYLFRSKFSFRPTVLLPFVLLFTVGMMGITAVAAQDPTPIPVPNAGASNPSLMAALNRSGAQVSFRPDTGKANFISTGRGNPIKQPLTLAQGASGEDAARGFLSTYGPLFGITNQSSELVRMVEKRPDATRKVERFQQVYNGVPVVFAELNVQVNNNHDVVSANGEALPDIAVSTTPTIVASAAAQTALQDVVKIYKISANNLTVSTPTLWVYNPQLITDNIGDTELVWRMEVKATNKAPINQFVLIDAQRGYITLQFNQIDTALDVATYTANDDPNITLPGSGPLCTESLTNCSGNADAQGANDNAIRTYNFYNGVLGRDSIDNAGLQIVSTVHYRDPKDPFSAFNNAFWNGEQMVYGDARTYPRADDVVAHELTHGVTQYESHLAYIYQSGAINESLSDVFGEFVELSNGVSDPSWLVGQKLLPVPTGGALRSMSNPPAFGDPDRINSPYYNVGEGDNGGVHTNSGVNNKAAYLISQGGIFNGRTIIGIGTTKTAHIYYEVQTNFLTSGSDYLDLYNALYQACVNLIGTAGIDSNNCQQVRNATLAVGMNLQPLNNPNYTAPNAPLCPSGSVVDQTIFTDDLESGTGNWTFNNQGPAAGWGYDSTFLDFPHSGQHYLYADDYAAVYGQFSPPPPYPNPSTDIATLGVPFHIPPNAYLRFAHFYAFEAPNYDGGVVEYSINGGLWKGAGGLFDVNGYNGVVSSYDDNPLRGSSAFVHSNHKYVTSRMNLASLAGQDVQFRWRMGTDYWGYYLGWYLDDVQLYSCISLSAAPVRNYYTIATPTLTWNRVTNATQYIVQVSKVPGFGSFAFAPVTVPSSQLSITTPALSEGIYYWRVSANNGVTWSVADPFTIDLP